MKVRCYYYKGDFNFTALDIIDSYKYDADYLKNYGYVLNFLTFSSLETTVDMIEDIEKIEKNEMEVSGGVVDGPEIYIYIYKEKTIFEDTFGYHDDLEWPTSAVKQALEGWRTFLEMPKEKDTVYEYEIEGI